jgi:phospholipase/carboxylesterase
MPHTLQGGHTHPKPHKLLVLLHGWGARAEDMEVLAHTLGSCQPRTLTLAPQGFESADIGTGARQWFEVQGMTPHNRQQRIDAVLPRMAAWVSTVQMQTGVSWHNTVLAGFSQGASVALALACAHERLVSKVLAFSGRLPAAAKPVADTALHFFTGAQDALLPLEALRASVQHLHTAGSRVTLDVAENLGHSINMQLLDQARGYLVSD